MNESLKLIVYRIFLYYGLGWGEVAIYSGSGTAYGRQTEDVSVDGWMDGWMDGKTDAQKQQG